MFNSEQLAILTAKGIDISVLQAMPDEQPKSEPEKQPPQPEQPKAEKPIEQYPADVQEYIRSLREENKTFRLKQKEMSTEFDTFKAEMQKVREEKQRTEQEAEERVKKKLETEGNYKLLYEKTLEKLEQVKDYSELKTFKESYTRKLQADFESDLAKLPDEDTKNAFQVLGLNGHEALKRFLKTIEQPGVKTSIGAEKPKSPVGIPSNLDGLGMDDHEKLATMHPDIYRNLVQQQIRRQQ